MISGGIEEKGGIRTSAYQYHPRSCIVRLYVVLEVCLGDCPDILSRTKYSSAQRSILKCSCMQMVKNDLLSLSFNLRHFKQIGPLINLCNRYETKLLL